MITMAKSALGIDWVAHEAFLARLAQAEIGPKLQSRIDPDDLVQQTLLRAFQARDGFRGSDEREIQAWLRSIFRHVLIDYVRRFAQGKRARERSLEASPTGSTPDLKELLRDSGVTPSHRLRQREGVAQLLAGLDRLPAEQHRAVELRYLQGESLGGIARTMEKSLPAVAGLLRRGLKALRDDLHSLA